MLKHNLLIPNQYGFHKKHSTYMATLNLVDKTLEGLDIKICTAALTNDHCILPQQLTCYGVLEHL